MKVTMNKEMEEYFQEIENKLMMAYNVASGARKKGYDPNDYIEMPLARNMAERVYGLISAVAPQIEKEAVVNRIFELEKQYGMLNWRVALQIAEDVAREKFCKFKDEKEAMEIGIRTGIAYITVGIVASPLEGFVGLKIKKRKDGKEYFSIYFSGPIRSAGGTGAAVSVLIADYIRKQFGYSEYDPTELEIKRYVTEIYDYHERITNLQYLPSEEELEFLTSHLPVQINGDPSERIEVSNYKSLDRVETNRLRNGVCLVVAEGLAQKAPKLVKQLEVWGKDFGLEHWEFLSKLVKLQKKIRAKEDVKEEFKIMPDYNYIKDLVAGRPVLTYPLRKGGFRLRYGRSRLSGLSSMSMHPATMIVLDGYIGIGTQLKYERPGKSSAMASCDSIEGPIVKLSDDSVIVLDSIEKARKYVNDVVEILYLGDFLVNYGEFFNRAHKLVPVGYCEEWYKQEIKKALTNYIGDKEKITDLIKDVKNIDIKNALEISRVLNVPLHPRYTYHWGDITKKQFLGLFNSITKFNVERINNDVSKMTLLLHYEKTDIELEDPKRVLELLGVPHKIVEKQIVVENEYAHALSVSLGVSKRDYDDERLKRIRNELDKHDDMMEIINLISEVKLRDKGGTYIGARMGRPEKAKMRKLIGSPHVLFPVGKEGGRLRSFQSALEKGKITAEFPTYYCSNCGKESIYKICEYCNNRNKARYFCRGCNKEIDYEECEKHGVAYSYKLQYIDIKEYLKMTIKKLGNRGLPELVKGVRGTSNKRHVPEHLSKAILRAYYDLYVNKDGTIRYDMTEMPITTFKAKEIGTNLERLKELGYKKDIYNNDIIDENQLIELRAQDIILPSCVGAMEDGADNVLVRVAKFVDDLLVRLYNEKPFYNIKSKGDLIGQLVIGLAPHTSAAIVGRVIGFSKTQGCFAHPYWHAAQRRDCFSFDTSIPIYNGQSWSNVKIGEFVEGLNPNEVVDSFGTLAKDVEGLKTLAYNLDTKKIDVMPIKWFTKHSPNKLLQISLENGRRLKVTENHKIYVYNHGRIIEKRACDLDRGDQLIVPYDYDVPLSNMQSICLEEYYKNSEYVMVRNIKSYVGKKVNDLGVSKFLNLFNLTSKQIYNYISRDSFPIVLINKLLKYFGDDFNDLPKLKTLAVKRNFIEFPHRIEVDSELLEIIGFYIAEGFARRKDGEKGYYQVDFAVNEDIMRNYVEKMIWNKFGLKPNKVGGQKRLTYSSRLLYEFFVNILKTGKNAHNKRVPNIFLNLPKEKIASLLRAYFEGDGCVSLGDLRVSCDTVSGGLINDLEFLFSRYGIYIRKYESERYPGRKVRDFYLRKNKKVPKFKSTKIIISSSYCNKFYENINFVSRRKKNILKYLLDHTKAKDVRILHDDSYAYLKIIDLKRLNEEVTYCLNVPGHHNVIANGIIAKQCEGDECCIMLLMDALLNFSRDYLPMHRGATQDAPLVLTSMLIPSEVDDMVFDMDVVNEYPLELYEAALEYKNPWDIKIEQIKDRLNTENQYNSFGFTHDTDDMNNGILVSAYKLLPSMREKVKGQMKIAEKIRAVDENDVARLIIDRHFMRDIRGNLRKFSTQQFRCVGCNEKYRRPPLVGKCTNCGGKIIFTVSEGFVTKYLGPSLELAEKYNLPTYLRHTLELTKRRIEGVFGRDKEKQEGLGRWF